MSVRDGKDHLIPRDLVEVDNKLEKENAELRNQLEGRDIQIIIKKIKEKGVEVVSDILLHYRVLEDDFIAYIPGDKLNSSNGDREKEAIDNLNKKLSCKSHKFIIVNYGYVGNERKVNKCDMGKYLYGCTREMRHLVFCCEGNLCDDCKLKAKLEKENAELRAGYDKCIKDMEFFHDKIQSHVPGIEELEKENTELREAFDLAYELLCDMHFYLTQPIAQGSGHINAVITDLENVAKTNKLFIEKKAEEGGEG